MDILKRIGAIVLVLVLIGMYVATFIMGITGSDNLMGMIFLDVLGNMAHRQGAQTQGRRYERSEQVEQYKYVEKNYII